MTGTGAGFDPAGRAASLATEFRAFAFKGNVVDLAVGVVVGAAFGKIIDSLVKNVLMPMVAVITPGDQGYTGWAWTVNGKEIPYGLFLGDVVNFLIVSAALFVVVKKFLGWVTRTRAEAEAAPPAPTKEQELLAEIRDLLKAGRGG